MNGHGRCALSCSHLSPWSHICKHGLPLGLIFCIELVHSCSCHLSGQEGLPVLRVSWLLAPLLVSATAWVVCHASIRRIILQLPGTYDADGLIAMQSAEAVLAGAGSAKSTPLDHEWGDICLCKRP